MYFFTLQIFFSHWLSIKRFLFVCFLNQDTKKAKTEESAEACEEPEDDVKKADDSEVPSLPLGLTGDGQGLFQVSCLRNVTISLHD
jgi:hypothetical protein